MKLLTREEFRESVFKRDNYKCVVCGKDAKDAHHIIERRLFSSQEELGGYFIDNGASLCEEHHIKAEQTILTCDDIRDCANIQNVILPSHLYDDVKYDKWGNPFASNGKRYKGELFYDESVQKILTPVLDEFLSYIKYPRTHHLPWSEKVNKDDRVIDSTNILFENDIVVTVKMDGQNITMYNDYIHTRSTDSESHPSQNWVKGLWSRISYEIPKGWRICGENLYAKHTIEYNNLSSYFQVFSIWDENNRCLSWEETVEYCKMLNLTMVPVLYIGDASKCDFNSLNKMRKYGSDNMEGYVVRSVDDFSYFDFKKRVAKFVHKDFSNVHGWNRFKIVHNKLKE